MRRKYYFHSSDERVENYIRRTICMVPVEVDEVAVIEKRRADLPSVEDWEKFERALLNFKLGSTWKTVGTV